MNFVNYKFQPSFYDKQSFYDRLSLKLFHDHEARIQPPTTYRIQALAIFILYHFCVIYKATRAFIDKSYVIWSRPTFSQCRPMFILLS